MSQLNKAFMKVEMGELEKLLVGANCQISYCRAETASLAAAITAYKLRIQELEEKLHGKL